MTIGQKLPGSEMVVVTTPQSSVAEVSERAGTMGSMMNQDVLGVIENMSWLETTCPHCDETHRIELYGSGGGAQVADTLADKFSKPVPLLAQIPMDQLVALGGEKGTPIVMGAPERPAGAAFLDLAERISKTKKSIVGKPLNLGVQN